MLAARSSHTTVKLLEAIGGDIAYRISRITTIVIAWFFGPPSPYRDNGGASHHSIEVVAQQETATVWTSILRNRRGSDPREARPRCGRQTAASGCVRSCLYVVGFIFRGSDSVSDRAIAFDTPIPPESCSRSINIPDCYRVRQVGTTLNVLATEMRRPETW